MEPTQTPKGSNERIAVYAARIKALKESGVSIDSGSGEDIPSLFVEGDNNDAPAVQKPGSRETYPTEDLQKMRGDVKKCSSSIKLVEDEYLYPHPFPKLYPTLHGED